ncbi:MAG: hypothetical protein WB676_04455, partial [Bryobacteraceae bacterium]
PSVAVPWSLSYRDKDEHRVDAFHGLLTTCPNLRWIAPDLEAAALAAKLRSLPRLRTPDALQAATAMRAQARGSDVRAVASSRYALTPKP